MANGFLHTALPLPQQSLLPMLPAMPDETQLEEATRNYQELMAEARTLLLATQGHRGAPEASTAPFIRDEQGNFYIFVSELARHTKNLLGGRRCGVMIAEEESACGQLFARRRASFTCEPEEISTDSTERSERLQVFRAHFGHIVDILASMADFHLIRLTPISGRAVLGFAAAYQITGPHWDQLTLRADQPAGHR